MSSNVLAERLEWLEHAGVARRRRLPPPAASRAYELTEWGMELEPVAASLGRHGRTKRRRRAVAPAPMVSLAMPPGSS